MRLFTHVAGPIATNCYIVAGDKGDAAVIDPGAEPEAIDSLIKENGLSPRYIILTHGHFDHFGGLKGLKARYPDTPVLISAQDAPRLEAAPNSMAVRMYADPADYEGLGYDRLVGEGDRLPLGELTLCVYATPGHSKGGICIDCGDVLFTGDTLFAGEVGRTDLEGGDYGELLRSIRRLAELPGDRVVYPGHDVSTTLADERLRNPYMREANRL
jgi:glyoxylase-like metal-dependent hydrolase (beta-lactamase superfamily II)